MILDAEPGDLVTELYNDGRPNFHVEIGGLNHPRRPYDDRKILWLRGTNVMVGDTAVYYDQRFILRVSAP